MKTLIGSVSSGTMRNEDLIPCFVELLSELNEERSLEWQKHFSDELAATAEFSRLDTLLAKIEQAYESDDQNNSEYEQDGYFDSEDAAHDLESLFNELENFAPPYFYFGAHPGDGSDYGFWLSEDFQEQFDGLQVSDTSDVPADYCGEVLHINDHGNCTLYAADNGKLTEVWAVV